MPLPCAANCPPPPPPPPEAAVVAPPTPPAPTQHPPPTPLTAWPALPPPLPEPKEEPPPPPPPPAATASSPLGWEGLSTYAAAHDPPGAPSLPFEKNPLTPAPPAPPAQAIVVNTIAAPGWMRPPGVMGTCSRTYPPTRPLTGASPSCPATGPSSRRRRSGR